MANILKEAVKVATAPIEVGRRLVKGVGELHKEDEEKENFDMEMPCQCNFTMTHLIVLALVLLLIYYFYSEYYAKGKRLPFM